MLNQRIVVGHIRIAIVPVQRTAAHVVIVRNVPLEAVGAPAECAERIVLREMQIVSAYRINVVAEHREHSVAFLEHLQRNVNIPIVEVLPIGLDAAERQRSRKCSLTGQRIGVVSVHFERSIESVLTIVVVRQIHVVVVPPQCCDDCCCGFGICRTRLTCFNILFTFP